MKTQASRPPFIDLGMISSSRQLEGLIHPRQPGEELVARIVELFVRLASRPRGARDSV